MRWIAEDPRPVIKINPHEAGLTVAGGRLTGSDNIYWRIAQFLMPFHSYAPSSMPGENMVILPRAGLAQGPPWKKGWEDRAGGGMMMGPMQPPMKDWVSQLRLTPDQVPKIQESREAFLRDTLAWRDELAGKRFDLRNLLRGPGGGPSGDPQ